MEKYQFPKIKDEIQFENFTRDLLNLIYQDNSFQLYGRKGQVQDGLDGYSTIHPVFFQCKHKSSPHVKDKKLEEELEAELHKAKPKIEEVSNATESKFLFFTTHPNTTKLQDKARVLSTDNIIVEYWGWETTESYLNNLYLSKNREFYIKYYPELAKGLNASKISPQLTTKLGKSTLIGREKELQEIDERLKASKTLLVKGIGGIGKSTIASNYLHRHKDEYDYYGFFEGLESFETELEGAFKLEVEQDQDRLDRVLRELIKLEPDANKLLVIDDVKEIKENQEKLEKILGLEHNGYMVLLTSRFKVKNVEIYPLPSLESLDAQKLFLDNYKTEELEKVNQITEYLDYHPLFVELVAKTIENEDYSLNEIIEKFEFGELAKIEFIDEEEGDEVSFNQNLQKLFEMQKKSLKDEYLLLLKQLAVLPSIDIELSFLEEIFDRKLKSRLNFLVAQGWLIESIDGYKLHQVVKEFLLVNYAPKFEEIESIVDFFNNFLENSVYIHIAIEHKNYLIYFFSLIQVLRKMKIINEKTVMIFNNISHIYRNLGMSKEAFPLLESSISMCEILFGEEHISTASSYSNLGSLYHSIGDFRKAKKLYNKSLMLTEKISDKKDMSIAYIYNNQGELYRYLGLFDESEKYLLKALDLYEELLSENDIDKATIYNNLGEMYRLKFQYDLAYDYYMKSLKINTNIFDFYHPNIALTYNNLGLLCTSMGDYINAKKNYDNAMLINSKLWGENHSNVAMTYNNLAMYYHKQNLYDEAEEWYLKALATNKDLLGLQHTFTIMNIANLAGLYQSKKEYKEAEALYFEALSLYKRLWGEEHIDIASIYNNLAILYFYLENFEEAYTYIQLAYRMRKKYLVKNHPLVLESKTSREIIEGKLQRNIFSLNKKVGRNDPCSCSSGKKYKKCCGKNT